MKHARCSERTVLDCLECGEEIYTCDKCGEHIGMEADFFCDNKRQEHICEDCHDALLGERE